MVDIIDRLHFSSGATLTIKHGGEGWVPSIHNIKKIDNVFWNALLEITSGAPEKNRLVAWFCHIKHPPRENKIMKCPRSLNKRSKNLFFGGRKKFQ